MRLAGVKNTQHRSRCSKTSVACPLRYGLGPNMSPQPSCRVASVGALPQYAGKGVAFDCLSQGLNMDSSTGLPVDTTWLQVKAGELTCGGAEGVTAQGPALLVVMLVLHLALVVGPIYCISLFYNLEKEVPDQTAVQAPGWLLAAMAIFSMSSLGEIAQHVHDNWLYINLIPSFYSVVFYGGLASGQAALAFAVGGTQDRFNRISATLVPISILSMTISTLITSNNAPTSVPHDFIAGWAVLFASLGVLTTAFARACFKSGTSSVNHWVYSLAVAASYGLGVSCAVTMAKTGSQLWHVPTTTCFLSGFGIQVLWIQNIMKASVTEASVTEASVVEGAPEVSDAPAPASGLALLLITLYGSFVEKEER